MNFDDLKDQLRDQVEQSRRQIQESTAYNTIKERYDLLSPKAQKITLSITGVFAVLLVLALPLSLLLSASEQLDQFEEEKQLIRQLLQSNRELKQGPRVPRNLPPSAVESRLRSIFNSAKLLDEQIGEIQRVPAKIRTHTPKGVNSQGFTVQLSKLNIRQVVDISYSLQSESAALKLTQMSINAHPEDDHYYNLRLGMASLSIPIVKEPAPAPTKRKGRRNKRKARGNR